MILSFDIGIKNLSYCLVKSELNNYNINKIEIIDWDIINILKDNEKVKSINIDELSKRLYIKLNEVFKDKEFDIVLLENQPVLKNPVMKSVQMLIYGFFLYQKTNLIKNIKLIKLINASNKLKIGLLLNNEFKELKKNIDIKDYNTKIKYSINKKKAIDYTLLYLNYLKLNNYKEFFNLHKKKDDLADSFLQSIYYIEKFNLII
jgi:DNA-binding Lrp family transcriptional regulator